jgi:hypothetical protein
MRTTTDLSLTVSGTSQVGTTFMTIIGVGATAPAGAGATLTAMNTRAGAQPTIYGTITSNQPSASGVCGTKYNGNITPDGFILSISSGNIYCTVSVYGWAI